MQSDETKPAVAGRIMSIDALRGFDMFWITGGVPLVLALVKVFVDPPPEWLTKQFEHKLWNGFSAEDLIMPLFLFVVGAAMPFSFAKRVERGQSKKSLYLKIARRFVILWVLGMMMQGHLLEYDPSKLVLFSNTLQAIAVGYALTALLMIHCGVLWQLVAIPVLLVGYWLLMVLVPVPGHGAGVLEPGANLARYIDEAILGRFRYPMNYTWILSGLGFTSTVLLGATSGHLLRLQRSHAWKVAMLLALRCVDAVVLFNATTPIGVILRYQPGVFCVGPDYSIDQVAGRDLVESWGGRIHITGGDRTVSTTQRILECRS